MAFNNPYLEQYYPHFETVHGWCYDDIFNTLDILSTQPINQRGGIAEIGIQDGKLFLLLNQTVDENFKSYAIDIFNDQHLNVDKSGAGQLDAFRKNLETLDRHQGRNTLIIQGDSTDSSLQLTKMIQPGSIKFFSIDGGHTPIHVMNDLALANTIISNEGVVILDDIMNHWWTGVLEGWVKFNSMNPTLVPFAMGHNKLYLCKISYREYYVNLMSTLKIDGTGALSDFFGWKIVKWKYHKQMSW